MITQPFCQTILLQVVTSLIQQMAAQNQGQAKNAETLKIEVDLRLQAEEKAREEVRRERKQRITSEALRGVRILVFI